MSLRTKIALGMLLVPGIVAVALVTVIVIGIRAQASRIQAANASNRDRVERYHRDLSSEFGQAWLLVTRNWIDGNLSIHRSRPDREDELVRRLKGASIFRSVVFVYEPQIALDGAPAKALVIKEGGAGLPERQEAILGSGDQAMFARLTGSMALARDNTIYRRFYYFDTDRPQPTLDTPPDGLLKLEMVASAKPPPMPAHADVGLSSLVNDTLVVIAIGALAMTLSISWTIRRFVLAPLDQLLEASERAAAGDYSQPLREVAGNDEMAELIRTFNAMQRRIEDYRLDMESRVLDAADTIREQEHSLIVAQRLAATGTLAAGLAHEINNPLGGMMNATRRIRDRTSDPQAIEYLGLIDEGLTRIRDLMGNILDFSRGRDSKPGEFDVKTALERAVEFARYRYDGKHALRVSIDDNLPPMFGDASAIGQVVVNLLLNAADALVGEGGKVELRARLDNGAVEIAVRDTGAGMDEHTRSRIFDPFFTTKAPGKGTGLGLAIVHTVVSNHDGTIDVTSEPGKGTTFTLRFPVAKRPTP